MVLILQKLLSAFYNLKDYSKRCLSINYYSFHKKTRLAESLLPLDDFAIYDHQ